MSRGFEVTDPREAPIFRTAEAFKPTIYFDEGVMGREIWRLVRAGFKKQSYVPRISKIKENQFTLTLFEPYTPYIFSSTETPEELGGGEPDISRCIMVTMQFGKDPSGRDPDPIDFTGFREKMYLARLTRLNEIISTIEELKKSNMRLMGREREVWLPLLAIAKKVGEKVFNEILSLAVELFESKKLELYKNERLIIEAIEKIGGTDDIYEFYAKDLYPQLKTILVEEREELTEKQFEKYWSTRKIGRLLRRMNINGKLRDGIKRYSIKKNELDKLKAKYLITGKDDKSGLSGLSGFSDEIKRVGKKPT